MLTSLLAFAVALQPPPVIARSSPPAPVAATLGDRIARVDAQPLPAAENIGIRVTSPEGLLWEGNLRVGPNQSASYQQSVSQSPAYVCPPGSYYDRSERRHLNLTVNAQHHQQLGQTYRVEASWARPVDSQTCVESGTRTVQVNHSIQIAPGETGLIEGDAGLRIRLTRAR